MRGGRFWGGLRGCSDDKWGGCRGFGGGGWDAYGWGWGFGMGLRSSEGVGLREGGALDFRFGWGEIGAVLGTNARGGGWFGGSLREIGAAFWGGVVRVLGWVWGVQGRTGGAVDFGFSWGI